MTAFRCQSCGGVNTEVIDTRRSAAFRIRRRRKCDCGHRFTTVEIPVEEFEIIDIDGGVVAKLRRDARRVADAIDAIVKSRRA
jgi:transcriptional regulator NrdR family protein